MKLVICLDKVPAQGDTIWDFTQRDLYDILMDYEDHKMDHYTEVTVLFEDLNRLSFKTSKRNGYFLDSNALANGVFDIARTEKFWVPMQERAITRLAKTGKFHFITTNGDYRSNPHIRVIQTWT